MSDFIGKLALLVFAGSALILSIYTVRYLLAYFKATSQKCDKARKDCARRYLDNVIQACVAGSTREAGWNCRAGGSLLQSEKDERLADIYEAVLKVIGNEMLNEAKGLFGNLDEWIVSRIEFYIWENNSGSLSIQSRRAFAGRA